MAHVIDNLPGYIALGQEGEFGATEIAFDVSAWADLYPTGAGQVAANPGVSDGLWLTYTRQGETDVYPVSADDLDLADDILTWTVGEAVLDVDGQGTVVVHCTESGVEKRSVMAATIVATGHAAEGTAPEPLADYIAKWGAIDISITALDDTLDPTASVTQDDDGTHLAIGVPVTENQLMRDIEGTMQTATLNDDDTVAQIVHTDTGTGAVIRTDVFTYMDDICTQVRTLAAGPSLTIVSNLITLTQTISDIEL